MHQTKNEVGTAQVTKGEKKEKGKGILRTVLMHYIPEYRLPKNTFLAQPVCYFNIGKTTLFPWHAFKLADDIP